jgi:hypothetical protein
MRTPVIDQIFGSNKAPIDEVLKADFAELREEVANTTRRAFKMPTKIASEDDLSRVGVFISDCKALVKKIDAIRMEEGKPILEAQRGLNDFFKRLSMLVSDNAEPVQRAADDYARRKAAEERARREREAEDARRREEEARIKAEKARSADAAILATAQAQVEADKAERAEAAAGASVAEMVKTRVDGVTASARAEWTFRIEDYDAVDLNALRPYMARADVEKAIRSMVRIQKGSTTLAGVSVYEDVKSTFRR